MPQQATTMNFYIGLHYIYSTTQTSVAKSSKLTISPLAYQPATMESKGKWSSMKVEIQCKKLLKPSSPTPPHLQSLKISAIDQLQPPFYITLIFHFDVHSHDQARTSTSPEKLARLEASLADVLALYYPFAGRFDGESTVSCKDQGVEFVMATVDGKLCELVDGDYDSEILLNGLSRLSASGIAENPLILIQVRVLLNCFM